MQQILLEKKQNLVEDLVLAKFPPSFCLVAHRFICECNNSNYDKKTKVCRNCGKLVFK